MLRLCALCGTEPSPLIRQLAIVGCFTLWVVSLGITGLGIWQYVERDRAVYEYMDPSVREDLLVLAIFYIVTGFVWFFLTSLGFVGANRENMLLLRLFAVTQVVMIVPLVTEGCLTIKYRDAIVKGVDSNVYLERHWITGYQDDPSIDFLQVKLQCCGIDSYMDYNENMYFNCSSDRESHDICSVPHSCCRALFSKNGHANMHCGANVLSENASVEGIYTAGCKSAMLSSSFVGYMKLTGGAAFAVTSAIVVCVIPAIILDRQISNSGNLPSLSYRHHQGFQHFDKTPHLQAEVTKEDDNPTLHKHRRRRSDKQKIIESKNDLAESNRHEELAVHAYTNRKQYSDRHNSSAESDKSNSGHNDTRKSSTVKKHRKQRSDSKPNTVDNSTHGTSIMHKHRKRRPDKHRMLDKQYSLDKNGRAKPSWYDKINQPNGISNDGYRY